MPYGNRYGYGYGGGYGGYGGYGGAYSNGPVYRLPNGGYSYPMTPEQYTRTIANMSAASLGMNNGYGYRGYGGGYNNPGYNYGGNYQRRAPRDTFVHDAVEAIHAANPDINQGALAMIGATINNARKKGIDIEHNAHALENLHERLTKHFSIEESEKAMKAFKLEVPASAHQAALERETEKAMARERAGISRATPADEEKPETKVVKKTTPAGRGKTKEVTSEGSSFVGSIVGMIGAAILGYNLMNTFGGGFSAVGLVAVALLAMVGATVGGRGGAMISKMFASKEEPSLAQGKQRSQDVASAPEKTKEPSPAEKSEKMEAALSQYRNPQQKAEEANGVEATMPAGPSQTPVNVVAIRPSTQKEL